MTRRIIRAISAFQVSLGVVLPALSAAAWAVEGVQFEVVHAFTEQEGSTCHGLCGPLPVR